jgi:hypothetical protein
LEYHVEKKIIDAAKAGKRRVFISISSLGPFDHLDTKITPLNKAVLAKLIELGYSASIEKDGAPYVPRGLADDFDNSGPMHTNYGFKISW